MTDPKTNPQSPRAKRETRRISSEGRAFIESQESLVLHVYRDEAGIATIGYGHVLHHGDPVVMTQEQADAYLANDLRVVETCLNANVHVALEQCQFDALCSFVFNCGTGAFVASTLARKLNAGDYLGAAEQLLAWDHITVNGVKQVSPNLLARRQAERAMFLESSASPEDVA